MPTSLYRKNKASIQCSRCLRWVNDKTVAIYLRDNKPVCGECEKKQKHLQSGK